MRLHSTPFPWSRIRHAKDPLAGLLEHPAYPNPCVNLPEIVFSTCPILFFLQYYTIALFEGLSHRSHSRTYVGLVHPSQVTVRRSEVTKNTPSNVEGRASGPESRSRRGSKAVLSLWIDGQFAQNAPGNGILL